MEKIELTRVKRYFPKYQLGIIILVIGYFAYFLLGYFINDSASAFSGNGAGTEQDPYQITTCEQLQEIEEDTEDANYIITQDIECSSASSFNGGSGFASIDTLENVHIDGRNHRISNLVISGSDSEYFGIFGQLINSSVKNIELTQGSIRNNYADTTDTHYTGSIAGYLDSDSLISGIDSTMSVSTTSSAGGIAGFSRGVIEKSSTLNFVASDSSAPASMGGIVAHLAEGSVSDTYSQSSINIDNTNSLFPHSCGGLVGIVENDFGDMPTIDRSFTYGYVSCVTIAGSSTGGLIGTIKDNSLEELNYSYTTSGLNQNSDVFGDVIGTNEEDDTSIFNGVYFDPNFNNNTNCVGSGQSPTNCLPADTTGEPSYFSNSNNAPFTNWDFTETWEFSGERPTLLEGQTSPDAPTSVSVTSSQNTLDIQWSAPTSDGGSAVTDYSVQYRSSGSETWITHPNDESNPLSASITGLEQASAYFIRVQAVNEIGNGIFSEPIFSATPGSENITLSTPTVTITETTADSISLDWEDIEGANYYRVRYSEANALATNLTPSQNTGVTITGLSNGTKYFISVQAYSDELGSEVSEPVVVNATTQVPGIYEVSTCEELQAINDDLSGTYNLANDIDCSDTVNWNSGSGFEPIGEIATDDFFTGTLNGNGHTISNVYANSSKIGVALFEQTNEATFRNFKLSGAEINIGEGLGAAGLIGRGLKTSVTGVDIININLNSETGTSGALAAFFNGSINDTTASGVINSSPLTLDENLGYSAIIGGLVGFSIQYDDASMSDLTISNSSSTATINVDLQNTQAFQNIGVGGLLGSLVGGEATDSYAKGNINITDEPGAVANNNIFVGGFAGGNAGGSSITNVYSTSTINVPTDKADRIGLGGIVGLHYDDSTVNSSFSDATFTSSTADYTGGITGSTVRQSDNDNSLVNGSYYRSAQNIACIASEIDATQDTVDTQVVSESCTEVDSSQQNYFFERDNLPQSDWDFRSIWSVKPNDYPTHLNFSYENPDNQSTPIRNCEELQAIRNNLSGSYYLGNNINCIDTSEWNDGEGFLPIGTKENPFKGKLNGQGHTISNLNISFSNQGTDDSSSLFDKITGGFTGVGLFGNVGNNVTIKNLTLKDSVIGLNSFDDELYAMGAIVGNLSDTNQGNFTNLSVENTSVTGALGPTGGVFGAITTSSGNVSLFDEVPNYIRLILPQSKNNNKKLTIDNIRSSGSVDGLFAGGLVGATISGWGIDNELSDKVFLHLKNSSSSSNVTTLNGGGLVGLSYSVGSDPLTLAIIGSLMNQNFLALTDLNLESTIGEIDQNVCGVLDDYLGSLIVGTGATTGEINTILDTLDSVCEVLEGKNGFTAMPTLIDNSSYSGKLSNCGNIVGVPVGNLGGIVGLSSGTEVRNSQFNGVIETCSEEGILPPLFGEDVDMPGFSVGMMGGITAFSLNSRITNSYSNGSITPNVNSDDGMFAGATGGLTGLNISLSDMGGRPSISGSHSNSPIDLTGSRMTLSSNGGLVGMFIGSGTISDSHSNNSVRTNVMDSLVLALENLLQTGEFTNFNNIIEAVESATSGQDQGFALGANGGLVGTSIGINFKEIVDVAVDILDTNGIEGLSSDYGLKSQGVTISNSSAQGNVKGPIAGGLIGASNLQVNIKKSFSDGNVSGTIAGGIVGINGFPELASPVPPKVARASLLRGYEENKLEGETKEEYLRRTIQLSTGELVDNADNAVGSGNTLAIIYSAGLTAYTSYIGDETDLRVSLSVSDSYSQSNVTGIPLAINFDQDTIDFIENTLRNDSGFDDDTIKEFYVNKFPTGLTIPSIVGGIGGISAPAGGKLQNVYSTGDIHIKKYAFTGLQSSSTVLSPFPNLAGGLFGVDVVIPDINLSIYNDDITRSTVANSFSASRITTGNKGSTASGLYSGINYSPLTNADVIMQGWLTNEVDTRQKRNFTRVYADEQRSAARTCEGLNKTKTIQDSARFMSGVIGLIDGSGSEPVSPEDLPNVVYESLVDSDCRTVNSGGTSPNYFIGNNANAPLDSWDFESTWKTNYNDYPDFVGSTLGAVPPGQDDNGSTTSPIDNNTWPAVPVFGFGSTAETPAIEVGDLPQIGATSITLSGLSASIVQALPWLLLLVVAMIYLYQAWAQQQANKRFRNAIQLSRQVKSALNSFLTLTSHYLVTPTTTMRTALELLVGIKKISGEKAKNLTKTASELASYVNTMNNESQKLAATTKKKLELPGKGINPESMKRWVVIPVILAGSVLVMSLFSLEQSNVVDVTRASFMLNVALYIFTALLLYVSFRIRQNNKSSNLVLDKALTAEKAVVEQRKDFMLEAETKLGAFVHELQLGNKTLEKSKNAKPYMNGLKDLENVASSFNKVYSFSTTNMPYSSDVSSAVLQALAPIRLEAKTRHIPLTTNVPPEVDTLLSLDEAHHIVYTLMDNALKFSAEGSPVTLDIISESGSTTFIVKDKGIGIDEDRLNSLTQPFTRGTDIEKFDYEGMGLNLYITRLLVEKYGGDLEIHSQKDVGTTVKVIIKDK